MGMGIIEELDAHILATGIDLSSAADRQSRWIEICVCGHERTMHGPGNGGEYGGVDWGKTVDGCAGPPPERGRPLRRIQADGMAHVDPTCPCMMHRPVAEVDRPARYFRQKVWTRDRVHPLVRGMRAMTTRLDRSKRYLGQGAEEAARRFRWLDDARECRVCGKRDGTVWPCYVNDQRLSQMRCSNHYELPIGEAP
jgi:hypothetical protein